MTRPVTPVLARVATQEWEWAQAWTTELVRFLVSDAAFGEANQEVISGWIGRTGRVWRMKATMASRPLATLGLCCL